jgi:hypothetical protein
MDTLLEVIQRSVCARNLLPGWACGITLQQTEKHAPCAAVRETVLTAAVAGSRQLQLRSPPRPPDRQRLPHPGR